MYETENCNKYILLTQIYASACLMKWMGVEHVQRGREVAMGRGRPLSVWTVLLSNVLIKSLQPSMAKQDMF